MIQLAPSHRPTTMTRIRFPEEFTGARARSFDVRPRGPALLLDLADTRSIDAAGLRALTRIADRCRSEGSDVAALLPGSLRGAALRVGLHVELDCFFDADPARAWLRRPAVRSLAA